MFRKGDLVTMTSEALENYGDEYKNVPLRITHVATKYMPASRFYVNSQPEGYHPGYDNAANGKPLYDLEIVDTKEELNFSLYYWEVKKLVRNTAN